MLFFYQHFLSFAFEIEDVRIRETNERARGRIIGNRIKFRYRGDQNETARERKSGVERLTPEEEGNTRERESGGNREGERGPWCSKWCDRRKNQIKPVKEIV